MPAPRKYPQELRERAVRLWRESEPRQPVSHVAKKLGVHPEALRNWIRQDQADRGERNDRPSTDELELIRQLRRENQELKRVNEILRVASSFRLGARPDPATVVTFIAEHRDLGVERMVRVFGIAPSTFYGWQAAARDGVVSQRCSGGPGAAVGDRRHPR